jgi:adenosylhomocysteine nucleosidase
MIGMIAVWREATALLKCIDVETTTAQIQARLYRGRLAGQPVVLAEVGIGKVQTAAIAQYLLDRYKVELMISCGSAGALAPQLQVGDVILADKVTLHDAGLFAKNGFEHLGIYDNAHPDGLHYHRFLAVKPQLLARARQAAAMVDWPHPPPQIQTGCLVTGDQVIADDAKKQWLRHTFNALAADMESGAMAQVAFFNNIPWLAVRAVSDNANSTIDIDLTNLITYSDEPDNTPARRLQQTAHKVAAIVRPTRLKTLLKIRQAVQAAAYNAAQVTAAIIAQLE